MTSPGQELHLNAFARLQRDRDIPEAIRIVAPVRSDGIRRSWILASDHPQAFGVLKQWLAGGFPKRIVSVECPHDLQATGLYLASRSLPRAVRYSCSMDNLAKSLPYWKDRDRFLRTGVSAVRLVVNARIRLLNGMRPRSGTSSFVIQDPMNKNYFVLDVDPVQRAMIERLQTGMLHPAHLSSSQVDLFILCRILIPEVCRPCIRSLTREDWYKFQENRFAIVQGLLSPAQVIGIERYLKTMKREGFAESTEVRRCFIPEAPAARAIGHELSPTISNIVNRNVRIGETPLLVEYQSEEQLHAHCDSETVSEITVSIQLRQFPLRTETAWPLFFDDLNKKLVTRVALGPGDGVVFVGKQLRHWRDALPGRTRNSVLLLNYFYQP